MAPGNLRALQNLEIGAMFSWMTDEPGARFGLAMKYCPTEDLEFKAKVDHDSKLAFALTHHLSKRVCFSKEANLEIYLWPIP